VRINFAGDISLDRINHSCFKIGDNLHNILSKSDLNIANLESAITTSENRRPFHPVHLKAGTKSLDIIGPFHAVSLANNHIQDFGPEGIEDTKKALMTKGMSFFGIGSDQTSALNPLIYSNDGQKVAVIGTSKFCTFSKFCEGTAGDSSSILYKTISKLKLEGHYVIIFYHWGYEYIDFPAPRDRIIAHHCINKGADMVIGTHPHVIQAIEYYKQRPIIYSLGNFIFSNDFSKEVSYLNEDIRTRISLLVSLEIQKNKLTSLKYSRCVLSNNEVEIDTSIDSSELLSEVKQGGLFSSDYRDYIKKYVSQLDVIRNQNVKIKQDYLGYNNMDPIDKFRTYKNLNWQDAFNRFLVTLKKKR